MWLGRLRSGMRCHRPQGSKLEGGFAVVRRGPTWQCWAWRSMAGFVEARFGQSEGRSSRVLLLALRMLLHRSPFAENVQNRPAINTLQCRAEKTTSVEVDDWLGLLNRENDSVGVVTGRRILRLGTHAPSVRSKNSSRSSGLLSLSRSTRSYPGEVFIAMMTDSEQKT